MGKLSSGMIYDAGKRDPRVPRTIQYKDERRTERFPQGRFERFVDKAGNVMQIQLVAPGVAATQDRINKARLRHHADGFVEHGQCPCRNGHRFSEHFRDEFAEMPPELQAPCSGDPQTMRRNGKSVVAVDACPHIEWLIAHRRKVYKAELEARRAEPRNLTAEALELQKQQYEEARKANEAMRLAVEAATAGKPKKAATE